MILVRHGLMIVGDPIGGKTQAFKVLSQALADLHAAGTMEEDKVNKYLYVHVLKEAH